MERSFTDERIEKLFRELGYEAATSTSGMKTTWAHPARMVGEPAIAA